MLSIGRTRERVSPPYSLPEAEAAEAVEVVAEAEGVAAAGAAVVAVGAAAVAGVAEAVGVAEVAVAVSHGEPAAGVRAVLDRSTVKNSQAVERTRESSKITR